MSEYGRVRVRVGVGADREECGVAEVEQAGQADDDVQAHRQQDEARRRWRRQSNHGCSRWMNDSGGSLGRMIINAVDDDHPDDDVVERWCSDEVADPRSGEGAAPARQALRSRRSCAVS